VEGVRFYLLFISLLEDVAMNSRIFIFFCSLKWDKFLQNNINNQTRRADKLNLLEGEAYAGVDLRGGPHPLILYAETWT